MAHQINIFVLLFGALQGGLLSLWFLRKQQRKSAHVYFASFLIVVGLQLTLKVITKSWMMDNVHFLYVISYYLPFLVGPLLFLYAKARNQDKFYQTDLVHFLPFVVLAVAMFISVAAYPQRSWIFHPYTRLGLQLISLSAYAYFAYYRIVSRELKKFLMIVFSAEAIIAVTLALMQMFYGQFPDVRLLFLVLTVLIYWISYRVLSQPDLFFISGTAPIFSLERKSAKYAHSSLKAEEAARIENAIRKILLEEKLFLDSTLTVDILAARIKTSKHRLSQVLNERIKKTYLDLIGELRLEETKRRLSDPTQYRFTIAAIALDSGFSSVSSFNEVFKRRFGITPSKFREASDAYLRTIRRLPQKG